MKRLIFLVVMGILSLPLFSPSALANDGHYVRGYIQVDLSSVFVLVGGIPLYPPPPVYLIPPRPVYVVPLIPGVYVLPEAYHFHDDYGYYRPPVYYNRWNHDRWKNDPPRRHQRHFRANRVLHDD